MTLVKSEPHLVETQRDNMKKNQELKSESFPPRSQVAMTGCHACLSAQRRARQPAGG